MNKNLIKILHQFIMVVFLLLLNKLNLYGSTLSNSYGFSAYGVGVSGARTAGVADWTATYFNIAGLTNPYDLTSNHELIPLKDGEKPTGDFVEIGFGYAHEVSFFNITPNYDHLVSAANNMSFANEEAKNNFINTRKDQINQNISSATGGKLSNSGIIELGLSMKLNKLIKMPFDVPLKFGLALSIQNNLRLASINQVAVDNYNFLKYRGSAQSFSLLAGTSTHLWKNRLSIGIGISASATGQGQIDLTDVIVSNAQQYPNQEVRLSLALRVAPIVGVIYRQPIKSNNLLIGFSFRGENYLKITPLQANATLLQDLLEPLQLLLTIAQFYVPHTMSLGLSGDVYPGILISGDIEVQLWSQYVLPGYVNEYYKVFVASEANKFGLNENEIASAYALPQFRDIFIPKLGIEISPNYFVKLAIPLWIRFGYAYEQAIVDASSNQINFLDNQKHKLSTGLRIVIPRNKVVKSHMEIDFGFQYHLAVSRKVDKQYTTWETNSTERSLLNPSYNFSGHIIVMNLSVAFKF